MLLLRFHKPTDPRKPGGLTVVRSDGSSEYQPSPTHGFIVHDLAHYAVETILDLPDAFLSLLARGHRLGSLGQTATLWLPDAPAQARQAEFLVSTLQSEFMGFAGADATLLDAATYNEMAGRACRAKHLPLPTPVSDAQLAAIRSRMREILERWAAVPHGGVLELRFPPDPRTG